MTMNTVHKATDRRSGALRRGAIRFAVLLVAASAAVGCATHKRSVADRFVHRGEPSINLGGPTLSQTSSYMAQLRKLSAEARPRPKQQAAEVAETQDVRLRDALAALKAEPSAAAHRAVAIEYRRLAILDAAFSHLSKAIRLEPHDASLFDLRARIWRAWMLPHLGLADARKAVQLAPDSATAWNTLGLLLESSAGSEVATKAYLQAVVLDRHAAYAWNNLCRVWMDRSDGQSASKACERTVQLDASFRSAELNLNRARVLAAAASSTIDDLRRPVPPFTGAATDETN
jgi:Flp pilus assembly protein TadD